MKKKSKKQLLGIRESFKNSEKNFEESLQRILETYTLEIMSLYRDHAHALEHDVYDVSTKMLDRLDQALD